MSGRDPTAAEPHSDTAPRPSGALHTPACFATRVAAAVSIRPRRHRGRLITSSPALRIQDPP
ncbi:putative protein OS=Streptomyces aurantiogriseus OX=66870 GN=GCM10010251_54710 PE=4 SV=1 [Streptomyces aurantiogriseus]|uniref:Uncharacterized protein n=1 Tax=Streptomyces aurantiogriseus TaxID=66870 RepID=A0A918FEZ9_9ACTN|nr:hypothetical protein GCM10010251_54710 [Streptomyces aurantiogriseus]